jgi:hypothetical protein
MRAHPWEWETALCLGGFQSGASHAFILGATMNDKTNYFSELYKVNVAEHVEKKNGYSYVSWPFAVAELRKRHPTATWEVVRFDGLPYLKTELGYFVEVKATVEGVSLSQIHPVLDNRNAPIKVPTTFHINTSIQRALVKVIALHGLGLFVYAGEDLPEEDKPTKSVAKMVAEDTPIDSLKREEVDNIGSDILAAWTSGQEMDVLKMWGKIEDNDVKIGVWSWLAGESKLRSFIKANKAITKEVA